MSEHVDSRETVSVKELEAIVGPPSYDQCAGLTCEEKAAFVVVFPESHVHACPLHAAQLIGGGEAEAVGPFPCPFPHDEMPTLISLAVDRS